jgi:hypothetical protein
MENEDKIVAGLQQLHDDLEKLRSLSERNYASAMDLNKRTARRFLLVYLTVVVGAVLWSFLARR